MSAHSLREQPGPRGWAEGDFRCQGSPGELWGTGTSPQGAETQASLRQRLKPVGFVPGLSWEGRSRSGREWIWWGCMAARSARGCVGTTLLGLVVTDTGPWQEAVMVTAGDLQ